MIIVLTTVPDENAAEALAHRLLEQALAACVQILPKITSAYIWEGEIRTDSEHLLLIKTLPAKWNEIRGFIEANHPYEVPEIIALDVENVSGPYQEWLNSVLAGPQTP